MQKLKLHSDRDSVHSQNSMQLSEDFLLPGDISKDTKVTADTRSMASRSRPNLSEKKRTRSLMLMTKHLLEFYKKCSPSLQYNEAMKPHRILTEIPEN